MNSPTKNLTRVFNIGYSSFSGLIGNSITFCCLIDDCGFETMDLGKLVTHIEDHTVEWYGFCMTCNAQVNNDQIPLTIMEFKHMTEAHLNKNNNNDCDKNSDRTERTPSIKCKALMGFKLLKLKEAEIGEHFTIQDAKSSKSKSVVSDKSFLKIADVTSTKTAVTKPDSSSIVISNVVSLGAPKRDYGGSVVVEVKQWTRKPTLKREINWKRMMRDISLFALYKCMDIECSFTTNDSQLMLPHLRNHENNAVSQANNVSDANIPSFLECAYCNVIGDSCQSLVKHIQVEHQSSVFQCPYCFYRSCAAYNVVVHLSQFHQSHQKSVLVCNGKPKEYATEKVLIEKSRQEFVRPLRCTEDCNKITFVMDYFVQHMKSSTAHSEEFKCQFCGIFTDEQLSSVESTLTVHLGQSVDAKFFQLCPNTEQQLSMLPCAQRSTSNGTFSNPEKLGSVSSGLMLSEILNYKDFEMEYVNDYDKYFANNASPSLSGCST